MHLYFFCFYYWMTVSCTEFLHGAKIKNLVYLLYRCKKTLFWSKTNAHHLELTWFSTIIHFNPSFYLSLCCLVNHRPLTCSSADFTSVLPAWADLYIHHDKFSHLCKLLFHNFFPILVQRNVPVCLFVLFILFLTISLCLMDRKS